MKILNLQAENIKRIKAIDITPKDNVVVIAGKNGEGKSSVLDSIYWALAGKKHIQDKPIRGGEEKASVKLDLGKYIVERRFTDKGSYLDVRSAEGASYPSPQDLLNDLTAAITFDPLDFARMEGAAQYKTLRGLVKLEIDIDALEKANEADFTARTDVNRMMKSALAEYDGMTARIPKMEPEDVPSVKIDVVDVANRINVLKDHARNVAALNDRIENGKRIVSETEGRMKLDEAINESQAAQSFEVEMKRREEWDLARQAMIEGHAKAKIVSGEALQKLRDALKALEADAEAIVQPAPDALKALEDQLASANQVNALIDLLAAAGEKKKAYDALHDKSEALTKAMSARDEQKSAAVTSAKMPIAGLGIAGGRVTFNGIPFDQASSAEQIKVSTSIAMAMNPELRVIRIKDGALLDDESMSILRTMATENDFQIWIERVGGDQVGIIIEDGQVKNDA